MKRILTILTLAIILISCNKKEPIKLYSIHTTFMHKSDNNKIIHNANYNCIIKDKNNNIKYQSNGLIQDTIINNTTIVESGDYIQLSMEISNIYDTGLIICKSDDNSINKSTTTSNVYIDEDINDTIKTIIQIKIEL